MEPSESVQKMFGIAASGVDVDHLRLSISSYGDEILHIRNEDGMTLLHVASAKGHLPVVRLLLNAPVVPKRPLTSPTPQSSSANEPSTTTTAQRTASSSEMSEKSQNEEHPPTSLSSSHFSSPPRAKEEKPQGAGEVAVEDQTTRAASVSPDDSNSADEHAAEVESNTCVPTLTKSPESSEAISCWASIVTPKGHTALHWAALKGHLPVVTTLVRRGFDPSFPSNASATPVHCAAANGHAAVVEALLREGSASPNLRTKSGSTPLSSAIFGGHVDCVKVLLSYGADPNFAGLDGKSAVQAAEEKRMSRLQFNDSNFSPNDKAVPPMSFSS